jgi:hypothetical protein
LCPKLSQKNSNFPTFLQKKVNTTTKKETSVEASNLVLSWHGIVKDVRTLFEKKSEYVYIPDLSLKI